jgi:hypothetical protein
LTDVRIIFVPGLKPKPPPDVHRRELVRVLLAALQRVRPRAAEWLAARPDRFRLVAWTYLLYGRHRDIELDTPGIERLLRETEPEPSDIRAMDSWPVRLTRMRHVIGDSLPLFGHFFAAAALRTTILDAGRYLKNSDGAGDRIRELLHGELARAWADDEKVLLIGHSLGSVIAYDALWELSHGAAPGRGSVDLFMTIGSPLGTRFIRRSVRGANERERKRYPTNIRRWVNLSARGDLTALYPRLRPAFREMVELKLVAPIEDYVDLTNHYYSDLGLNVHESYGYLANPFVARVIGDWLEASGTNFR